MLFYIIPSLFFGWSLGANDAANVFGPPVASKLIRFRDAVILSSIFIVIGALLQGQGGMETMKNISAYSLVSSSISVFSAAVTMTIMTILKVPVSSSQAIIGAIIGINLIIGNTVNWSVLTKIFIAWIGTPLGGMFFGFLSFKLSKPLFSKIKSPVWQGKILKIMVIVFGCYGSYALGANNVANITGVFVHHLGFFYAALIGSVAIALGVLTFSKRVMFSVGHDIANLDYFSSSIVIFAESVTVWIYAIIGIPVSTSQAVVGAVIGTSLAEGNAQISRKQILKIIIAWVNTPVFSAIIAIITVLILKVFGYSI
ncbi:MAG TPA: inorganic phosphate transporter [Thermotogota bacterium]|nr:inorganic phosphate transporter [Thermotogota bacterium]HPJ87784.1 inorganic phosphate transporter [Thermotogota bacterium]HPR95218.1 inorganic phosphate transporter [Thermotogota bacterium]